MTEQILMYVFGTISGIPFGFIVGIICYSKFLSNINKEKQNDTTKN